MCSEGAGVAIVGELLRPRLAVTNTPFVAANTDRCPLVVIIGFTLCLRGQAGLQATIPQALQTTATFLLLQSQPELVPNTSIRHPIARM